MKLDNPAMQVAGQIFYVNQAIERGLEKVSEERKLEIQYEDFCQNPEKYYYLLREKLRKQNYEISDKYCGEKEFNITRKKMDLEIEASYREFMKSFA